jgi:hypothetical protein
MISRNSILAGAFLLIVHCASAGLAVDREAGANGSLPALNPAEEAREFGRPDLPKFYAPGRGNRQSDHFGCSRLAWFDDFRQCELRT